MNKLLGHIFSVESITAQLQAVLSVYPQDKREQIVNLLRIKPPEERRRMILNIIQNRQVSVCVCVVHVRACVCMCMCMHSYTVYNHMAAGDVYYV